jgi:DNA-binding protein HU-beta
VTKDQIVSRMAERAQIPRKAAGAALSAFVDSITTELRKGGRVPLVGFGTFAVRKVKAHAGRNPKTGEQIRIPACCKPVFKAGTVLKAAVNRTK